MPLLAIVHLAIVAYFGIHVIRSGRQIYWLIILFSFPALGALVYFFAEYLPEVRHTRGGHAGSCHIDCRHAAHTRESSVITGSTRGASTRITTMSACTEVAPVEPSSSSPTLKARA